jgi:hypothetical protein
MGAKRRPCPCTSGAGANARGKPSNRRSFGRQSFDEVGQQRDRGDQQAGLALRLVPEPNEAAAAEYYPAIYWYSMLNIPDKGMFPGTGPNGNGMTTQMKIQLQWLDRVKTNGCYGCHQPICFRAWRLRLRPTLAAPPHPHKR